MAPHLLAEDDQIAVPTNVLFCGTHAGYDLPHRVLPQLRREFRIDDERLRKNFSDYATQYLIPSYVPEDQKVFASWRAGGDPNRAKDAPDLFRQTDFNGVPLWKCPLTQAQKSRLLKCCYDVYHEGIQRMIRGALQRHPHDKVIFFDIHDTGNCMMKPDPRLDTPRAKPFPELCLSYRGGTTCDPEIFYTFVELMKEHMQITPLIDDPYKGGYIVQRYGEQYNAKLPPEEKFHLNGIQVELGRYLYMDEKTQTIRPGDLQWVSNALVRAITELGVIYSATGLPKCA